MEPCRRFMQQLSLLPLHVNSTRQNDAINLIFIIIVRCAFWISLLGIDANCWLSPKISTETSSYRAVRVVSLIEGISQNCTHVLAKRRKVPGPNSLGWFIGSKGFPNNGTLENGLVMAGMLYLVLLVIARLVWRGERRERTLETPGKFPMSRSQHVAED